MDAVRGVVIGAGVVGLAVARHLALTDPERHGQWLILEQCEAIGTQTSSRNSEVIHAGMYYPQGSNKAKWCVRGRELLYAYLAARHVPHRRCGKLIVATQPAQQAVLHELQRKALANGVMDLQWWDATEVARRQPELRACAALWSPSTGILDSHAYMLSLQADFEHQGGLVVFHTALERVTAAGDALELQLSDGTLLQTQYLVNASGLCAPQLALSMSMYPRELAPPMHFAKGNYFALTCKSPFQHLVYPVPESAGLGVHLTLDMGGQAKFGPDVEWVDSPTDLQVNPARLSAFEAAIRDYWPGLPDQALQPAYAGMRPKISGPGQAAADFMLQGPAEHGVKGLVQLFGIESPGLTSSLAIAEAVSKSLFGVDAPHRLA